MNPIALVTAQVNQLWYALPLVVVVSLVYAATRHEEMGPILSHVVRIGEPLLHVAEVPLHARVDVAGIARLLGMNHRRRARR